MTTLQNRDRNVIWHPYTSLTSSLPLLEIIRAEGVWLYAANGRKYLDCGSSWWVNLHGHSHPEIAQSIYKQATTLEHCIFAGCTHEPAVELAEKLLAALDGYYSKVFYSDNGSTAVEVALKMCLQYWKLQGKKKTKIIALSGAYHGDTFGAMALSGRSIFNATFAEWMFDKVEIVFPSSDSEQQAEAELRSQLQTGEVAAFIFEPMIQGAAGMRTYSLQWLNNVIEACKKWGTLTIADEVMTGFGRTDTLFASEQLQNKSDIICLSKGITGGTMPLGATLCNQTICAPFLNQETPATFYHGHSFTANPLACAAALTSWEILQGPDCIKARKQLAQAHKNKAKEWQQHKNVKEIHTCGTIVSLHLVGNQQGYLAKNRDWIYCYFLENGILLRPLGNVIYIMPPYCINTNELQMLYKAIDTFLNTIQIE